MPALGKKLDQTQQLNWGFYAALFGILVLATWLRTYLVAVPSYWFDESSSWKTIQFDWDEMLTPISRNVHPPFYYVALKAWAIPFGDGPASLRLFSTTFGLLTILSAVGFTLEATRSRDSRQRYLAGLFVAALLALSPMHVMLGFYARMYTLATFLAVTCGYFCLRIARTGGNLVDWLVAAICGTLLTLTHYYGIFTSIALGIFMLGALVRTYLVLGWSTKAKWMALGSVASIWLLANAWTWWYPYFEAQRSQVTRSYWIPKVDFDRVSNVGFTLLSAKESTGWLNSFDHNLTHVGLILCCLVWIGIVLSLIARNCGATWLIALAVLMPWAISICYSVYVRSILVERYLIFAQAFLLIGLGLSVSLLRFKPALVISCVVLAWMGFWSYEHLGHRSRQAQVSELQNIPQVLDAWRSPEDPVLVGTPVIHTVVLRHAENPHAIYVAGSPDRFPHFQGAPLMRDEEYCGLAKLDTENRKTVFTVDVYGLYGRSSEFSVRLPPHWRMVRQKWFQERHGHNCRVFLREYQRLEQPVQPHELDVAT